MSSVSLNVHHNEKRSLLTVIYNGQSEWIMFTIIITVIFVEGAQLAWLAQLGERRSTEREVAGSNPGRTNTQGL